MAWGWSIAGGVIGAALGGPIGAAIGAGIGALIGNDKNQSDVPPLELQVKENKITLDDGSKIDVFEISFKGAVLAPADNTPAKFVLYAKDCTGGKNLEDGDPLGTSDDDYSSTGNGLFSPSEDFTLPYEATSWDNWTTMFTIPVACVNFPYRGQRDIEFALVVENLKEEALAFASCKHSTVVAEIGYMELDEMYLKAEKKAIQIAVMLAKYNSGILTLDTVKIIKQWISERVDVRDDRDDKNKVNSKLTQSLNSSRNSRTEINSQSVFSSAAKELDSYLPTAGKYNMMEFFLKVTASFENVSTTDIKVLDSIAEKLHLEHDEYQSAKHKYIPVDDMDNVNPFIVLGISNDMTLAEKKAKLRELFTKWNSLAIHKDKAIREKAEKMLNCIAECQKCLK